MTDFCKAVGGGVETHAEKVAGEVASVADLIRVRSGKLKGLSIPVKQVSQLSSELFFRLLNRNEECEVFATALQPSYCRSLF